MQRPPRGAQGLTKVLERRGVCVIPINVTQGRRELRERSFVNTAVVLNAVSCPRPELVNGPSSVCDTNDRHVEMTAANHGLKRRENLLVGEIAGGAEEDEGVRPSKSHRYL